MATGFGSQPLPYPPTVDGFPIGDPALGYLGQYLQQTVNAACEQIWDNEACPGRSTINHVFYDDPQTLFDDFRLPAIYIWRGKSHNERRADDLYLRTTTIEIAWIGEGAQEEIDGDRSPAKAAIAKAICSALYADCDPSWLVNGETSPLALLQGSSLSDACGFSRVSPNEESPQSFVFQRIEGAAPLPYYGFTMNIEVDEYWSRANTTRKPAKLNASSTTNAATAVVIHEDVP
jgi:hypothetical protein